MRILGVRGGMGRCGGKGFDDLPDSSSVLTLQYLYKHRISITLVTLLEYRFLHSGGVDAGWDGLGIGGGSLEGSMGSMLGFMRRLGHLLIGGCALGTRWDGLWVGTRW